MCIKNSQNKHWRNVYYFLFFFFCLLFSKNPLAEIMSASLPLTSELALCVLLSRSDWQPDWWKETLELTDLSQASVYVSAFYHRWTQLLFLNIYHYFFPLTGPTALILVPSSSLKDLVNISSFTFHKLLGWSLRSWTLNFTRINYFALLF